MMIACAILISTCFWHARLANIKAKIKQFIDMHHQWPEAMGFAVNCLIRLQYGCGDDADVMEWQHELESKKKASGLL